MPQSVVYAAFAAPFLIFIAGLAAVSIWTNRAPKNAPTATIGPPDA